MKLGTLTALIPSIGIVSGVGSTALAQDGSLVVYNPPGAVGDALIERFQELHPAIEVQTIAGGVGELFTRMNAEIANPQADVIICASTESVLAQPELFQSYASSEKANFPAEAIVGDDLAYGCSLALQAFIVNTNLLDADARPEAWSDLADPRLPASW